MLVLRAGKVIEHRALGNTGASVNERHVRIALAAPHPQWNQTLAAISGAQVIEAGDHGALLAVQGDDGEQARVLRELVAAGMPVARFAEETENLHQSYLRTVQPHEKLQ
jgi:ABC-2 type transport system ATP-binding protein